MDVSALLSSVRDLDWSDLFSVNCLDVKIDIFNTRLLEVLNLYALLRRRNFRNLPAPWLTDRIRQSMRERNLARRIWQRDKRSHDYNRFKLL